MGNARNSVGNHYGRGEILDSILCALREMGKDVTNLALTDLASVDEFHIRGREATVELANRAALKPGLRVLDVGSGLGGSVRYLASEHQVRAAGIDLTKEYVDVARALADLVGLKDSVEFHQSSALDMPFDDRSFDVGWTEHVQMNIKLPDNSGGSSKDTRNVRFQDSQLGGQEPAVAGLVCGSYREAETGRSYTSRFSLADG